MLRIFHFIAILGAALSISVLTGCKNYQLGHPTDLPFETIFVKPTANDGFAPQSQALISSAVRERILRDSRIKLISKEDSADVVLYVTIVSYKRQIGTRDRDDTETALDYDIVLDTKISLYDQRSGEYLIKDRRISDRSTAYVGEPYAPPGGITETGSLTQSEYQAMPRIARDIGRKIADEVLSAW
ncbi:MAG: LPS assembly lipoprotein LptE [Verrucomicrobiota bacterium]